MSKSLDTQDDLDTFREEMMFQLTKHKSTKTSLKDSDLTDIYELCTQEIHERLQKLLTEGPDVMSRQCVHIAVYCMFLFLKLKEVKK